MAAQINLLDDLQIKAWIKQGKPVARSDGGGLTFTLSASGTATWIFRYRVGASKRREFTIGNYPDTTLSAARQEARAKRAAIDKGADPAVEKQIEKIHAKMAMNVRALIADFKAKALDTALLAEGTIYYRNWDLDNIVAPKLGSLNVKDVTPAHIVHVLESAKRTWTITKRLLTTMKKLFGHACGKKLIVSNPTSGIELVALMGARPPIRKRVMLSEAELRTLLSQLDDIGPQNALSLRILLATCVRSIELAKARWEFIDLERGTWWVPDENVKTRVGFLVPLTPTVISWFRELKGFACNSPWVLPARTERRKQRLGDTHVGKTTLWAAIRRAFERGDLDIRRFTPHDTRSTAKGHMRNMAISREVSEVALNHALKGMEAIYDVREEIPERRAALERWAMFIAACEANEPWDARGLVKIG